MVNEYNHEKFLARSLRSLAYILNTACTPLVPFLTLHCPFLPLPPPPPPPNENTFRRPWAILWVTWVLRTQGHVVKEKNRMFSTLKCENFGSLASFARGNYHVKILLKSVMITITSTARPMWETSTFFGQYIWYLSPPPHTKKLATPLMSPYRNKKSWAPLGPCPPPPSPIQNCFRRACS